MKINRYVWVQKQEGGSFWAFNLIPQIAFIRTKYPTEEWFEIDIAWLFFEIVFHFDKQKK